MVHRDLKPENIMLSHKGEVKLIDCGTLQVAALTEISSRIEDDMPRGSVNYVASEYLLSNRCEHVSDILSLEVIAYEMLTNAFPINRLCIRIIGRNLWQSGITSHPSNPV